mmetsp:Transcript_13890/g.54867  ORF Transcript_13890/g.54867 Transcript_13890/m.54867 type:complete len:499 (-) Transcript_13890:844-2340(-)
MVQPPLLARVSCQSSAVAGEVCADCGAPRRQARHVVLLLEKGSMHRVQHGLHPLAPGRFLCKERREVSHCAREEIGVGQVCLRRGGRQGQEGASRLFHGLNERERAAVPLLLLHSLSTVVALVLRRCRECSVDQMGCPHGAHCSRLVPCSLELVERHESIALVTSKRGDVGVTGGSEHLANEGEASVECALGLGLQASGGHRRNTVGILEQRRCIAAAAGAADDCCQHRESPRDIRLARILLECRCRLFLRSVKESRDGAHGSGEALLRVEVRQCFGNDLEPIGAVRRGGVGKAAELFPHLVEDGLLGSAGGPGKEGAQGIEEQPREDHVAHLLAMASARRLARCSLMLEQCPETCEEESAPILKARELPLHLGRKNSIKRRQSCGGLVPVVGVETREDSRQQLAQCCGTVEALSLHHGNGNVREKRDGSGCLVGGGDRLQCVGHLLEGGREHAGRRQPCQGPKCALGSVLKTAFLGIERLEREWEQYIHESVSCLLG